MLDIILSQVLKIKKEFKNDFLFYRGHANANWSLLPAFARKKRIKNIESITYYDFVTRAGNLLPIDDSGWSHVFAMQHHGIPTRLLDWTTTFGVALFFAVREGTDDAAIWILNPYALNKISWKEESIPMPKELEANYYQAFVAENKKLLTKIVAISPLHLSSRVFNQKSAFTLHVDLEIPLDKMYPEVVKKIIIPKEMRKEVGIFLNLAGISEFSLFPDLDGLAKDIISENFQ